MLRVSCITFILFAVSHIGSALAQTKEDERAEHAIRVLAEIQRIPEQSIPDKLLDEARALIVIPDTIKAGLFLGGRRGHGLMSVKLNDGTWSNPAFVKITGGSVGFQAGVQAADVILAFMGDGNIDNVVNGKFTLGADASIAAGPVGRNAAAATDGQFQSEILSWSRARGIFVGVALDGAVLQVDDRSNLAAYGPNTTPRMIFEGRATGRPSSALVSFRDALEEATAAARAMREMKAARSGDSTSASPSVSTRIQTVPSTTPSDTATTSPSQGFEPVEGEVITTEPLQ